MSVCMCFDMYVRTYVYIHMYASMNLYIVRMYIYICGECMYGCIYVCVCVYASVSIYISICVHVRMYISVYVYVYVYINVRCIYVLMFACFVYLDVCM